MISADGNYQKGFYLIELMIVIAVVAILASIAMPRYAAHLKKTNAASCQTNRRLIENEEVARIAKYIPRIHGERFVLGVLPSPSHKTFLTDISTILNTMMPWNVSSVHATIQEESDLPTINPAYACPSDGVYIWLVSDPTSPNFPKVGCSSHYGSVVVEEEPNPTFEVDTGVNLADNGDFEVLGRKPRNRGWMIVNSKQVDGWDSSNNRVEVWADGMLGVNAPSGDYFIELDTDKNRNKPDVLSKSVETEDGRVYLVQMNARARVKRTSDFEITWGGESVSQISPTYGGWSEYSVKVVGNGKPISLGLAEITGQNNGLGALIDSIQVITTDEVR